MVEIGTTACKWDSIIPLNEMWERVNKLINVMKKLKYKYGETDIFITLSKNV